MSQTVTKQILVLLLRFTDISFYLSFNCTNFNKKTETITKVTRKSQVMSSCDR